MQQKTTLMERENESLAGLNAGLTTENETLTTQVETLSETNAAITTQLATANEECVDLRAANLVQKEDNKSLSISLLEAKRNALERKRDADKNAADAEDGRLAIAYMRQQFESKYLRLHDLDDLPMSAKEKMKLHQDVQEKPLQDCIDGLKALAKESARLGYPKGTRAAGMPSGYTGSAV